MKPKSNTRGILTIILFLLIQVSYSQIESSCIFDDVVNSNPSSRDLTCDNNSPDFSSKYNNLEFYIDNFSRLPEIVLPVNIIVWQKDGGSDNWQNTSSTLARFNNIISIMNSNLGNICDNSKPPNIPVVDFSTTKIRVVLKEVHFFEDDDMWLYGSSGTAISDAIMESALVNQGAGDLVDDLNINITGGSIPGAAGRVNRFPLLGNTSVDQCIITFFNNPPPNSDPSSDDYDFVFGNHLVHELGHILDLRHTYSSSQCNQNSPDYLDDVFGVGPSVLCPFDGDWSCDFTDPNSSCTNNVMGGTNSNCYFSPKQIAKMHRALALKTCRKYVRCDPPSNEPLMISSNEFWDFDIQLYQNLVIENGQHLTISCKVSFPSEAKIIVKEGGKLTIDGGVVSTFCSGFWNGIEVHGNSQLSQNTANQGVVEVINDGIIENAYDGIRTIKERQNGSLDWSKTGGIVRVNGATFKNCRRGIEFMSYHNLTPNGNESNNVSYIFDAEFITTDDYLEGNSPYTGVSLYDVVGVRVRNSIFENQRTDLANLQNSKRGSGIISVDANYNATSSYNFNTGDPISGTENEFRNLYYGVMTYGGTGRSDVKINDNIFDQCVYGVGLMGCNYGIIGRNDFDLLSFNNDPLNPIGFGVYTDGAYGFNIEANDFTVNSSSTNVNHQAVNVRNSSNNASSGKVYRNNISNVYLGTQTIGDNSALKVDCNDYVKGQFSTIDFNHADGVLADQGGIGLFGVPAKNEFTGICDNSTQAQIFKSSNASPFVYTYQSGTVSSSCTNLGGNLQLYSLPNTNPCPVSLANNAITGVVARVNLMKSKLSGVKNDLNTVRNTLNTGDRSALITIIENESNGIIKDSLISNSPYLSDRILIEYLNQPNTPPSGHIKQVLLANSPLSDKVMEELNNLNIPNGIMNQIENVQNGISERRLKEASESVLNTDRLVYIDAIVQEYLDTNWVDSAAIFLNNEGSVEALCALVPIEVKRRDTIRAKEVIDTIRSKASKMLISSSNCEKACELNEFCDFQQFIFKIALRQGGYFSITNNERNILEQLAVSDARISVNAEAILYFIDEQLPNYKGKELNFSKSYNVNNQYDEAINEKESTLFSLYPNPAGDDFVIRIEEEGLIDPVIIITDFTGKVVIEKNISSNETNCKLSNMEGGMYLVHIISEGKVKETQKLIYAK